MRFWFKPRGAHPIDGTVAEHLARAQRAVLDARLCAGQDVDVVIALHGVLKALDEVERVTRSPSRGTSSRTS